MSRPRYERPVLVRNVFGRMAKAGLPAAAAGQGVVAGERAAALCAEFGSPLFVFDEGRLRARVRAIRAALREVHPDARLCCSYKTNPLGAICAIQHQEGSLAEVVSGVEYEMARRLQVPGPRTVFNGPHKRRDELAQALHDGALVHADSFDEIYAAEQIAAAAGRPFQLGLRLSVDAGVHPRWDRFGFDLQSGQALQAARRIATGRHLRLGGLHAHVGTYVLDPEAFARTAAQLATFARTLAGELGVRPTHLDLGGGWASNNTLASQYQSGALAPGPEAYAAAIGRGLRDQPLARALPLLVEPGRAVVDDAGSLLTSVVAEKRLGDGRRALVVDAGVNLLFTAFWYRLGIAPALPGRGLVQDTTVYGPLCMNIDCLRESAPLPDLRPGDVLVVHPAGAYTFAQSMQFIRLRPAVVLLDEQGRAELVRRAEVLEDFTGPERLPAHLRPGTAGGR